jgi:hypothetical protein
LVALTWEIEILVGRVAFQSFQRLFSGRRVAYSTDMSGTWQGLTHHPPFHTSTMMLLPDGRIMVQEEATPHWHALTPDSSGSYLNGTWSTLADMSFWDAITPQESCETSG